MIGDIGWACIIVMATWIILLLLFQKSNYYSGMKAGEIELYKRLCWAVDNKDKISTKPIYIFSKGETVNISNMFCIGIGDQPCIAIKNTKGEL